MIVHNSASCFSRKSVNDSAHFSVLLFYEHCANPGGFFSNILSTTGSMTKQLFGLIMKNERHSLEVRDDRNTTIPASRHYQRADKKNDTFIGLGDVVSRECAVQFKAGRMMKCSKI